MKNKIAILPGDGIGPEVMNEALKVLNVISIKNNLNFKFNTGLVGASAIDAEGSPFPDSTKKICDNSDAILFGAIGDPKYDNNPKAKVRPEDGLLEMRKYLGLYANIRPVKTYDSLIDYSPIKKKIVSHLKINVPTYKKNEVPKELRSIPIARPGSRFIK